MADKAFTIKAAEPQSSEKMSRRRTKAFKNKCRLWCVLHGVKFGHRQQEDLLKGFVYKSACQICEEKNGFCRGTQLEYYKDKKILSLDTVQMKLYCLTPSKTNKISVKNRNLWCVEWVKYV